MAPDPRDTLELSSGPAPEAGALPPASQPRPQGPKPFLSLYFSCANAHGRAYKRPDGSCYHGRCPKCAKTIEFPIGSGGTNRRMFEVRCN